MKVGLLKVESKTDDELRLCMDESVYSSGVKNIHMKLDTFIAGIIEGTLKKTTNQKWECTETKCLADGDKWCEFRCRVR
jgi:predicted hydrocarbon binding protein